MNEVTRVLIDGQLGATERANVLLPLVYEQLRAVARQAMSSERPDHTLSATALVHEAYLRLVGDRQLPWQNRAHFYAAAAEAMRRILLDHARSCGRLRRGGPDRRKLPLSVVDLATEADPDEILALDEAICRLEGASPDAAAVVRLRFFAGLSVDDAAASLDISPRQVDRLWAFARAWLFRALRDEGT